MKFFFLGCRCQGTRCTRSGYRHSVLTTTKFVWLCASCGSNSEGWSKRKGCYIFCSIRKWFCLYSWDQENTVSEKTLQEKEFFRYKFLFHPFVESLRKIITNAWMHSSPSSRKRKQERVLLLNYNIDSKI